MNSIHVPKVVNLTHVKGVHLNVKTSLKLRKLLLLFSGRSDKVTTILAFESQKLLFTASLKTSNSDIKKQVQKSY